MNLAGIKKITVLLLALLILVVFTGCSPSKTSGPADNQANTEKNSTFTVTDQAGREVEIPKNVDSVAMTWGPATNFVLALGKGNIISAINYKSDFALKVAPNLANIGTAGRGLPDMEGLAKTKPDVFIHKASDTRTLEAVQALGIAAVGIYAEDPKDMIIATELVGKVLGAEEKARQLIKYYNDKNEFARNLVKDIPENERKTAIVMGGNIGAVANGGMLQSHLIENAGGINLAKDIEAEEIWPNVGTEQIFAWDPDFIFCVNASQATYTPDEIKKDPSMSNLKAVKNNKVMVVPSEQDLWDFPGIQSILGTLWMLNQMYPELYTEEEFIKEVNNFYKMTYGMTFEREWLGY